MTMACTSSDNHRHTTKKAEKIRILMVAITGSICLAFTAVALNGYYNYKINNNNKDVFTEYHKSLKQIESLQREFNQVNRKVLALEMHNSTLRSELATLTNDGGVVDTIIVHLKDLKSQNQIFQKIITPQTDDYSSNDIDGDAPEMPRNSASSAMHKIVTPKQKPAPIPSDKPETAPSSQVAAKDNEG